MVDYLDLWPCSTCSITDQPCQPFPMASNPVPLNNLHSCIISEPISPMSIYIEDTQKAPYAALGCASPQC